MVNALRFSRTDMFRGAVLKDDTTPVYEVHIKGEYWGHVSGSKGQYRAVSKSGFNWGPNRRTRMQAVEAAKTAELLAAPANPEVPEGAEEIRVTEHNFRDVIRVGDLIVGAEDLGPVKSIRLTNDRYRNAMVVGESGRDVLGLPSTVHVIRHRPRA